LGVHCKQFAKCPGVAKISKSYDVGGGYGKSSELLMMKEIIRNGPLTAEFNAPSVFGTYSSGLFSAEGI